MKSVRWLLLLTPFWAACSQVKFNSVDGTNNQPWASPAAFEKQGTGSPLGMGMMPGSR